MTNEEITFVTLRSLEMRIAMLEAGLSVALASLAANNIQIDMKEFQMILSKKLGEHEKAATDEAEPAYDQAKVGRS